MSLASCKAVGKDGHQDDCNQNEADDQSVHQISKCSSLCAFLTAALLVLDFHDALAHNVLNSTRIRQSEQEDNSNQSNLEQSTSGGCA